MKDNFWTSLPGGWLLLMLITFGGLLIIGCLGR